MTQPADAKPLTEVDLARPNQAVFKGPPPMPVDAKPDVRELMERLHGLWKTMREPTSYGEYVGASDDMSRLLVTAIPALRRHIEQMEAENAELREHLGESPSLERIRVAHTFLPESEWATGHRPYNQGSGERCYICTLHAELTALRADAERGREIVRRLMQPDWPWPEQDRTDAIDWIDAALARERK